MFWWALGYLHRDRVKGTRNMSHYAAQFEGVELYSLLKHTQYLNDVLFGQARRALFSAGIVTTTLNT